MKKAGLFFSIVILIFDIYLIFYGLTQNNLILAGVGFLGVIQFFLNKIWR